MVTKKAVAEQSKADNQFDLLAHRYEAFNDSLMKRFITTETLLHMMGDIGGKSILDIGCGNGHFCRLFKGLGASNVVGIDISEVQINRALSSGNRGITYSLVDARDMGQTGIGFDIVTSVFVFMYLENGYEIEEVARAIYERLSPNGKLVSIITNPDIILPNDKRCGREILSSKDGNRLQNSEKFTSVFWNTDGIHSFSLEATNFTKGSYETALSNAGFTSVEWVNCKISDEGIKAFGEEVWKEYRNNPYSIGIIARK